MIAYHYTNIDNLDKIITKDGNGNPILNFRATNCKFLNDQYENTLGLIILEKCLKTIEEELNVPQKEMVSPLLLKNREKIKQDLKSFHPNIGTDNYIISMSLDSDSLIMWSMYGNKGDGVAIGLDVEVLEEHFNDCEVQGISGKCTYWSDDMIEQLTDTSSDVYNNVKSIYQQQISPNIKAMRLEICNYSGNDAKDSLLHYLLSYYSTHHKHDNWKNEHEYRCSCYSSFENAKFQKDFRGDYIPFIDVSLPISALKEIMIGPKCGKNAYWMALSLLVRMQTYKLQNKPIVSESKCPLQ